MRYVFHFRFRKVDFAMREMTINLNGPDSPPSIILKAEPESSESHINYMGVSFEY